jgi:hypothetical protein
MNCKQVEDLLPLYAGRELEEKRATLLTEHLQICAACTRVADEYRESVQMTGLSTPPVFSEAVYAGIRQRVLREIETTAPSWSQTIASLCRPRLTWAIAGVLLIVVSMFAIYFLMNRGNVEQQLAHQPSTEVQLGTGEHSKPEPQDKKRADPPPAANVLQPRRKRSRDMNIARAKSPDVMSAANNVSPQPNSILEPMELPQHDSAASAKPLRVELQTKDPRIRIIWFVQTETKPVIPASKGI